MRGDKRGGCKRSADFDLVADDVRNTGEKFVVSISDEAMTTEETVPTVNVEEVEEIAPSSTSLERSILLDQDAVVECEMADDGEANDDDDDEEDHLYDLLNIEKRTDKTAEANEQSERAAQSHVEVTEMPSQSNSYTCNECGKNFNRNGNLKRHQESVHGTIASSSKNPKGMSKAMCGCVVTPTAHLQPFLVFRRNFNDAKADAMRVLFRRVSQRARTCRPRVEARARRQTVQVLPRQLQITISAARDTPAPH